MTYTKSRTHICVQGFASFIFGARGIVSADEFGFAALCLRMSLGCRRELWFEAVVNMFTLAVVV